MLFISVMIDWQLTFPECIVTSCNPIGQLYLGGTVNEKSKFSSTSDSLESWVVWLFRQKKVHFLFASCIGLLVFASIDKRENFEPIIKLSHSPILWLTYKWGLFVSSSVPVLNTLLRKRNSISNASVVKTYCSFFRRWKWILYMKY